MLNNFVGWAYTTGQIMITSGGTSWRPLVHAEDIARAVLASLDAPRRRIHDESFNGSRSYRIKRILEYQQNEWLYAQLQWRN